MSVKPELSLHYKLVWSQGLGAERASRFNSGEPDSHDDDLSSTTGTPHLPGDQRTGPDAPFSCIAWARTSNGNSRLLACSHGRSVHILRVTLVSKPSATGSGKPTAGFNVVALGTWKSKNVVVSLTFLDPRVRCLSVFKPLPDSSDAPSGRQHFVALDSTETLRLVDTGPMTEMEHETVSGLHFLFHDSFGKTLAVMKAESRMAYYHTVDTHRSKVLALVGSSAIALAGHSAGCSCRLIPRRAETLFCWADFFLGALELIAFSAKSCGTRRCALPNVCSTILTWFPFSLRKANLLFLLLQSLLSRSRKWSNLYGIIYRKASV